MMFRRLIFVAVYLLSFHMSIENSLLLAQTKKVLLAADDWAPYYASKLKNGGYFTELVKESFKRSGYDLKVDYVPWKRALLGSKEGRYDGVLGAFHSEDRDADYEYSDPVSECVIAFFTKKDNKIQYTKLTDLKKYKIGTRLGYSYSEEFNSADFLNVEEVSYLESNIKKVMAGRIDLFIDSEKATMWTLKTKLPDLIGSLDMIQPAYKVHPLYIMISKKTKNYKQIVKALNKGLEIVKKDGTYNKILKSHGY